MAGNFLIVFLRYPEKGKVKTRLAETLGDEFALSFYRICAGIVFKICGSLKSKNINCVLFSSEKENVNKIKNWSKENFEIYVQKGRDLGERMRNAFNRVFELNAGKVIIIGTDLLDMSQEIILKAFNFLDDYDIVLGPSADGGYYLLGMNKNYKIRKHLNQFFNSIAWSTNIVLEETINRIDKLNLKYKLMEDLQDIDTEENLTNWLKNKKPKDSKTVKRIIKEIEKSNKIKN
jgi:uncharacterized protein